MQRIIATRYGPPEVMQFEEAQTPAPGEGEVLVRVARAGINFADLLARMGLYPGVPKPPFVPGHEVAGTVAALGPAVAGLTVGDRVVAGRSFGGYATHTIAPRATVTRLPDSVSFDAAAALPVNYLTAWLAVVHPHIWHGDPESAAGK
ncbi:MAG: alcohol dehydrogenase catalytic domain-containing protein, partial [Candidatus Poseidoniia archaeon]|nr:alcohol dehydrogenase catalytic domain-containing protein [Candidatus Poseidoniia archaeon]